MSAPFAKVPGSGSALRAGQKLATQSRGKASLLVKSSSSEALEHISQVVFRNTLQCKPLQMSRPIALKRGDCVSTPSRVELLLAPKRKAEVFTPQHASVKSQQVNRSIKLASQWKDVEAAVSDDEDEELSASNCAYALYRLGCLHTYMSKMRQQELVDSGLIPRLLETAGRRMKDMDGGSLTLLFDACARLRHKPSTQLLDQLSSMAATHAASMEASQLSLLTWAWAMLKYSPKKAVLATVDAAVQKLAPKLAPQGVSLVLRAYQKLEHNPGLAVLSSLANALHRKLPLFKPSEIADCVEAFSALDFTPNKAVVQAIAERAGHSVHSSTVAGKRSLSSLASTTTAARMPGVTAAATGKALAERMMQQVEEKVNELNKAMFVRQQPVPVPIYKHRTS